ERVKPNTINMTAQSSKALQNSVFQNIVFISETSAGKCLRRGGMSHRRLADGTAHALNGDGRPPCADSKTVGQTGRFARVSRKTASKEARQSGQFALPSRRAFHSFRDV